VVILEAVIDAEGAVRRVRVLKGLPAGLSESAVETVKQWKFKPATLEGQPVAVIFNLTVSFSLQ
jgi:protein TonB